MMKNLYKNFSNYGINNNIIKLILTLIEFCQFLLAIDIIYPIKFSNNFYFFINFLNPYLYIEFIHHYLDFRDCTLNYKSEKNQQINIKNDMFINIISKYLNINKIEQKICIYPDDLMFCSFSVVIFMCIFFLVLLIDIPNRSNNSKVKDKKNFMTGFLLENFFSFCVNYVYLTLKYFSLTILIVISNFFLIPIFFYDNFDGIKIIIFSSIGIFCIYSISAIIFLNNFINCFNKKTYDKFTISTSETAIFALKLIVCILINLRYSDKYNEFFKVLVIILFMYNFYCQYEIFLRINVKNFTIYCLLFFLTLIIDKTIGLIIGLFLAIEKNILEEDTYFYVFHLITHFVIFIFFFILSIYKSKSNQQMTIDNINIKLLKILSTLLENILKNPAHLGNKELNISKLKNKILRNIRLLLVDHQLLCMETQVCFICKNMNYISLSFIHSAEEELIDLARILLQYGELMKFESNNYKEDDKEIFVFLKIIYLLIIDKEKIHRVSYFIKSYDKNSKYKFKMILNNLYEKIIYYSFDEDDKNYILQKCVELNEEYFSISGIMSQFVESLSSGKSQNVKFIIKENETFGRVYDSIGREMKILQDKYKFKEPSQYYKYLWCYGILFNSNYDQEIYLDSPENFDILDQNYHKNSNFIIKYDQIHFAWVIKKVPEIFISRFGFNHKDILGKNYESLFPSVLKEYEKKRLETMIMADMGKDLKDSRIKTIMLDSDSYLRSVEISFEILPFISENNFIVLNIHKIEDKIEDKLIIVNDKTEIISISRSVHHLFGISPEVISIFKDRINLNKLFKIVVDYKLDNFNEVNLNYLDYMNYFVNTYLSDSSFESEGDYSSFYQEIKNLNEKPELMNLVAKFDLFLKIDLKINYYIFKVSDLFEENKALKELEKKHFKKNNFIENLNFNDDIEKEGADYMENVSQAITNTYTQSSIGAEFFSSTNSSNIIRGYKKGDDNSNNHISNIIVYLNISLIFIGIIMIIIVNTSSQTLINLFDVNVILRKFYSDFYSAYVDFTLLINPVNSMGLKNDDFIQEQIKLSGEISINFSKIIQKDFYNITNNLFEEENKIMQMVQKYIGQSYFSNYINIQSSFYLLNGNSVKNFFFENLRILINNLYTITKLNLDNYDFTEIKTENPLNLNYLGQLINNQIVNFNNIYEDFIQIGENIQNKFYDDLNGIKIKIFVILLSYLIFHFILIILSAYQVKSFLNRVKYIFQNFSGYSKKEFSFLLNKIKYVRQLVNIEVKPSEAVNMYKLEKKKFSNEIKADKEKQKLTEKNNFKKHHFDEVSQEYFNEKNKLINNDSDFKIKLDYDFEIIKKVKKFIIFVSIVYFILAVAVLVIFTSLFYKLEDCKIINTNLINIENFSSHYLLNFKFNILSKSEGNYLNEKYMVSNPGHFYENYESFLRILENSPYLNIVKEYYFSLMGTEICNEIANIYPNLDSEYKAEFVKLCNRQDISNMNFYGIYSYYIKNVRFLYSSYFLINQKTKDNAILFFINKSSQNMNWIYFIFLRPFISEVRGNLINNVYINGIKDLSVICIICFVGIILIDFFIFILMKIYVINRISRCQENLINISNSLMI